MSITYLLVALGLGALAIAVAAMFWAVDSGQFDDLEAHGSRALEEDALTTDARATPRRAGVRCEQDGRLISRPGTRKPGTMAGLSHWMRA